MFSHKKRINKKAQDQPIFSAFAKASYFTGALSLLFIIGLIVFGFPGLGALFMIFYPISVALAVIFGIIGLTQIKRNPEKYTGRRFAMRGLILALGFITFGLILRVFGMIG